VVVMGKDGKRREVGLIGLDDGLIAGICGVSVLCTCSLDQVLIVFFFFYFL
jgi:hypothetical protein